MPEPVLQVWFDPVCPWCFIGYVRLTRAMAELGEQSPISIDWRPYQLSPEVPSGGVPRDIFFASKFGSRERADAAWAHASAAGEREGVRFSFDRIRLEPNTLDAHRAVRFAKRSGMQGALIGALFKGYFERGEDIGRSEVIAEIADQVGLDGSALLQHLQSEADTSETLSEVEKALRLGVRGVPAYGIEDKLFSPNDAAQPIMMLRTAARLASRN